MEAILFNCRLKYVCFAKNIDLKIFIEYVVNTLIPIRIPKIKLRDRCEIAYVTSVIQKRRLIVVSERQIKRPF